MSLILQKRLVFINKKHLHCLYFTYSLQKEKCIVIIIIIGKRIFCETKYTDLNVFERGIR